LRQPIEQIVRFASELSSEPMSSMTPLASRTYGKTRSAILLHGTRPPLRQLTTLGGPTTLADDERPVE
jgi:hypothetical protein